jgi:hypothetical protein
MSKRGHDKSLSFIQACEILAINPKLEKSQLIQEAAVQSQAKTQFYQSGDPCSDPSTVEMLKKISEARDVILEKAERRDDDTVMEDVEDVSDDEDEHLTKRTRIGPAKEASKDLDERMMTTLTISLVEWLTERIAKDVRDSDSAKASTLERLLKAVAARKQAHGCLKKLEADASSQIKAAEVAFKAAEQEALEALLLANAAHGIYSSSDVEDVRPEMQDAKAVASKTGKKFSFAQNNERVKVDEAWDDLESLFRTLKDIKGNKEMSSAQPAIEAFISATGVGMALSHFVDQKLPFSVVDEDDPSYDASLPSNEDKRAYGDARKEVMLTWETLWSGEWAAGGIDCLLVSLRELQAGEAGSYCAQHGLHTISSIEKAVECKVKTEVARSHAVAARDAFEVAKLKYDEATRMRSDLLKQVSGWQTGQAKAVVSAYDAAEKSHECLKSLRRQFNAEIESLEEQLKHAEEEEFKAADLAEDLHSAVDGTDSAYADSCLDEFRSWRYNEFLEEFRSNQSVTRSSPTA